MRMAHYDFGVTPAMKEVLEQSDVEMIRFHAEQSISGGI
jgi:hypothetical protein